MWPSVRADLGHFVFLRDDRCGCGPTRHIGRSTDSDPNPNDHTRYILSRSVDQCRGQLARLRLQPAVSARVRPDELDGIFVHNTVGIDHDERLCIHVDDPGGVYRDGCDRIHVDGAAFGLDDDPHSRVYR